MRKGQWGPTLGGRRRVPLLHGTCPDVAQGSAGDQMTLDVEGIVDGGVRGEKSLSGAGGLEPLHLALPSSHRLVRVLRPIVLAQALLMLGRHADLGLCGAIER